MPQITVIMPSYNVADYIEQCIRSVLQQTFYDMEILVIDAGSDDGTVEIIQSFQKQDQRIQLIISEQKSYGYQLNIGIREAHGKYITILDTDDYLSPDSYESLYYAIEGTGYEYVKGTVELFYALSDGSEHKVVFRQFPEEKYQNKEIVLSAKMHPELLLTDNYIWYGIYQADFVKKMRLHESAGASFQDLGLLLQTQMSANEVKYLDHVVYHYRQDNMKASSHNPKGFCNMLSEYRWAKQFLSEQSDNWHRYFYIKFFRHFMYLMRNMARTGVYREEAQQGIDEVVEDLRWAFKNGMLREEELDVDNYDNLSLLFQDSVLLFQKWKKRYDDRLASFRNLLKVCSGAQGVVIVCCGRYGNELHEKIIFHDLLSVVALADNSEKKIGSVQHGMKIMSVTEAAKTFPDALFVVANKKDSAELIDQLRRNGIPEQQVKIYIPEDDFELFYVK